MSLSLNLKKSNRYLPYIILIGFGIGSANYFTHGALNWLQWILLSLTTSLLIGYTAVTAGVNKTALKQAIHPPWRLYLILTLIFIGIGVLATEMEGLIKSVIFQYTEFSMFTAGNIYVINGIISTALGFSFFLNNRLFPEEVTATTSSPESSVPQDQKRIIDQIPVKKGGNILLIPTENIVYFEAYDNYSFLYDMEGSKQLCDYSLSFLEKRLEPNFRRLHRKYIVNTHQIRQFKPHLNGRYVIEFNTKKLPSIESSKTYAAVIKELIKIS